MSQTPEVFDDEKLHRAEVTTDYNEKIDEEVDSHQKDHKPSIDQVNFVVCYPVSKANHAHGSTVDTPLVQEVQPVLTPGHIWLLPSDINNTH